MLMNAFVLYKLHDQVNHKRLPEKYSSLDFIADWIRELNQDVRDAVCVSSASDASNDECAAAPDYKEHRRNWWQSAAGTAVRMDGRFHSLQHAANCYLSTQGEGDHKKFIDLRRVCMYCGERTIYFCEACNVPLCLGICNKKFHTDTVLPRPK